MNGPSRETITASDMTEAEKAAWEVAVSRGMNISRADLRALLTAAATQHKRKVSPWQGFPLGEITREGK